MDTEWKKELKTLLDKNVLITEILDEFICKYNISAKDVWDYVFEDYKAEPIEQCKGCKFNNVFDPNSPCRKCARRIKLNDYYEEETK